MNLNLTSVKCIKNILKINRKYNNVPIKFLSDEINTNRKNVVLVPGDGVGPEITSTVEKIFKAINVPVDFEKHILSEFEKNSESLQDVAKAIFTNKVALVGVLGTTINSQNITSLNIKLRKILDLYANVVHIKSLPGIKTRHKNVDVYLIREQTEGEYKALEHECVKGVVESLRIVSRRKVERIAKFAFKLAKTQNRKKVTAVHKANIMKLGDGLFINCCEKVSKSFPDIKYETKIIDAATMEMVKSPEVYDVCLMPNLYGSIMDNIGSGITGGAGVTPGASFSEHCAIFQPGARHTYYDGKGQNIANPIAMILCGAKLLNHIGKHDYADAIQKSVYQILEEGKVRTKDIGGTSTTDEFTKEVIRKLKTV